MNLIIKFLDQTLPESFKAYLEQKSPDYRYFIGNCETGSRVWFKMLGTEVVKLVFLLAAIGSGYILGLYFLRGAWFLFKDTMIGGNYIGVVNAAGAAQISRLLSFDLVELGISIVLRTALVCLMVGVISQLILLRRFFYIGRSSIIKLGWVGMTAALVAVRLADLYPVGFDIAFGLCFLPTAGILSPILASSGKLLPELNLLLFLENLREKREVKEIKDDIARIVEERGRE
ncbi:MAG: hypothetical protein R6W72_02785 [Desulfurivibrionaceae bacterium]